MKKSWTYLKQDEEEVKRISEKFNVSTLVARVIINKKLKSDEDIIKYLNPDLNNIYDPYLMQDMDIAVNRIIKSMNNKEKVVVYGDYDVDGITSITIIKKFLKDLNFDVDTYLPNRLDEGYGLNIKAINKLLEKNIDLIITVDCGISAIEEVEYAHEKGIEVLITDHHECAEKLPNAIAIVNPKRPQSKYPFTQLAGVGVAFKLIQAISMKLNLPKEAYLKYIDIVCIGTIADIVPLIDENRVIAKNGLDVLKDTSNLGMKALIEKCGFKKIDSTMISFGLSPRINACGRISDPQLALDLFLTEDVNVAKDLAIKLEQANVERQNIERKIFEEAKEYIDKNKVNTEPIIILGNDKWHHGVIGIVASKLVDLYSKPCILVCFEGEEGKASGRSLPHFDLFNAISNVSDVVEKFGGHEMAVGLTIKKEKFEKFKNELISYTKEKMDKEYINDILIDSVLKSNDIKIEVINELKVLEPFGEKNTMPLFVYKNLKIDAIRTLFEDRHLKLSLKDNQNIYEAIGFNLGHLKKCFLCGDKVDIVHTIEINEFNGDKKVQFNIKDIMKPI